MAAPEGYTELGRIGFVDKGNYASGTTYRTGDVVYYNGSTWVALKDNLRGVTPAPGANWKYMARGFAAEALSAITAVDTSGVLREAGASVTSQELIDAIADKVMTKLIEKSKIVNNLLATDATTVLSGPMGKSLDDKITQLNSDLGDVKTDISLQPVTGIDILTLTTGRYYATNCTNLPTGWVAAYLDVERLDNKWCRITAWPPYDGPNSPQITKQDNGTWRGWRDIMDDKISFEGVGKVTFAQNSTATSIRMYTTAVNYLYIEFLTATKNIKFGFYNGATRTDYWIM
jgi:hypothetical protein